MRSFLVVSLKGGVGKTTVTAGLGIALARMGYRVGLLDLDYRNPNLPLLVAGEGLSLKHGSGDSLIPPKVSENVSIFSMGFIWPPERCVMVKDEDAAGDVAHLLEPGVIAWPELDFMVVDSPPSTSGIVQSALKVVREERDGAVLVTHPSRLSLEAVKRSIHLLAEERVRVYGIVSNQGTDGSGARRYDMDDSHVRELADRHGLPIFMAIPHGGDLDRHFSELAMALIDSEPVLIPPPPEPGDEKWKKLVELARALRR